MYRLAKGSNLRKGKAKRKPVRLEKGKNDEKSSDKFIDSEDDNEDLRKEYDAQKEFDSDEDPYRDDVRKEGEEEGSDANENEFDRAINRVKNRKKKKGDGMTEQEREDFVHDFLVKMDKAAEDDNEARSKGKIAVNKLNMLDEVMENLAKRSLQTIFLERNLLQVLGQWLRPSPVDATLPNLTIRNKIIDILPQLQIEGDHLRRGKFGKVVNYLRECPKETPGNRKKLNKLLQVWTRRIFGKTDSFEQMQERHDEQRRRRPPVQRNESNRNDAPEKRKRSALGKLKKVKGNSTTRIGKANAKPSGSIQYRARVPQPRDFNFARTAENINASSSSVGKSTTAGPKKSDRKTKLDRKIKLVGKKKR